MDLPTGTTATSATWNYGGGRTITIEFEYNVMGGFQRPTRVHGGVAVIKPSPPRDKSLLPLAVPDDEMWTGYKESSFEGGHIIGLALGGPDHAANIAPMTKGSNCGSGTWGQIETEIKTMIRLANGGAVTVDFTLSYNDAVDPRVPARVAGAINGGGLVMKVNHAIATPHDLTNILTETKVFQMVPEKPPNFSAFYSVLEKENKVMKFENNAYELYFYHNNKLPQELLNIIEKLNNSQVTILLIKKQLLGTKKNSKKKFKKKKKEIK